MNTAELVSKMLLALARIGRHNGTKLPYDPDPPRGHNDPDRYQAEQNALLDYFRADTLYSVISKEREDAKNRCIGLGVFGKFESLDVGSYDTYDNGVLNASVTVNRASSTLDETKLENELNIQLGRDAAQKLLAKCRKPKKGARIVKVVYHHS